MQVEQTNQRQYSTTWIMLLALLTALGPLSIDMYLPALPQMADEFGVSTQMVANTLPAYFLGLAIGQLFYGPVSDRIGRKTPLYFGLTLYVIASLACVLVTNEWALIIASCIGWILLGSLGRRYATIAYGCLVISVYTMLGVHLFEEWYLQPALLVVGAAWYGLLSTISFLLFPVRQLQDQLAASYNALGGFLYAKSNLFDVDMTPSSYQQSMIDLSMENSKLIGLFNNLRVALLTRLKGDRGQKDTRRSLQYYFVAQDIHERADSAHIDYQKLTKVFQHSDILFRFQRILSIQGKACQDLAQSILSRTRYTHNKRFKHSFENLRLSLEKLREDGLYDQVRVNALFALYQNLKSIDAQLQNLETERNLVLDNAQQPEHQLKDDDLKGMKDIVVRIKQNLTPESVLFRHAVRLSIVLFIGYLFIQMTNIAYGYWILLTALFVCQPNFNATKRRLYLRIIGTLVGIIVGLAIIYFIPSLEGQLVMLVLSGILFFELRSKQYAQATAFITILALINFNLDGSAFAAGFPRFIDTIIGCALAWFGVSFIWPDWKFRRLPRSIRRALQAQCQYLAEVVTQYHQGRNNALNYRVVRRAAHNTDAEVASLISTLATEPNIDSTQKAQAFEFLCLSHTFLSYIAALGAHREQIQDQEVLDLLDQALDDIQGALLRDEVPDLSAQNMLQTIRQRLTQKESNENDQKSLIILQQLSLMLSILTRLSMLKQSLGHEPSEDGTEFASL